MAKRKPVRSKAKSVVKAKAARLKTVIVRGSEWLRADPLNNIQSMLYNPKVKKMCCLGTACHATGITKRTLSNLFTPVELYNYSKKKKKLKPFPALIAFHNGETRADDSHLAEKMMDVNDSPELTDAQKVKKLIPLGKKAGIRFVFKLNQ